MTRYLIEVYRIEIPENGQRRDDLTEATEDWFGKLGRSKCFQRQIQGSNLTGIAAELMLSDRPSIPGNADPTKP